MRIYSFAGILLIFSLVAAVSIGALARGEERQQSILLASTTSTDHSGLYDFLLPTFTRETGIEVRVVSVGTGRALSIASRGDADVLIVHDEPSEVEFMRQGYGIRRDTFMFNDYVLVGPAGDPGGVRSAGGVAVTLQAIFKTGAPFISRGDDSGTHKKELFLWRMALGEVPIARSWYREVGEGMGAALTIANELGAYTLSDRSTWISFNHRDNLEIVVENEPPLHNPYSVILVNPAIHPEVRFEQARAFADWLLSEQGLSLIGSFRVRGQQLFFPLDRG